MLGKYPLDHFTIIGCGPTGLLCAAAASMAGAEAEIYDAKDYVVREEDESVPLIINERGLKALRYVQKKVFKRWKISSHP